MVGGLKTLLVVEGQYHSILLRERQAFKELGERGSIGRDRNGSDIKLSQDAGHSLDDVRSFVLHDHSLPEEIPERAIFYGELVSFRNEAHPEELC